MARAGGLPLPTITDDRALGAAKIQRSLRFTIDDSTYLGRTSASASSTFTLSLWLKRGICTVADSRWQYIFAAGNNGLYFERRGGGFQIYGTGGEITVATNFRDPTAWYHIVLSMNSGTATTYVNNSVVHNAVAGFSLTTGSDETRLGRRGNGNYPFDGYMAEVHLVDGQAYDPSYFGFTDPQTGIWMPKRYEGAYGTNGFYLDFSDNTSTTTLGIDKSPNGNDFTLNNFSVSAGVGNDSLEDTPTNNFCTLNPLDKTSGTFSNGNLNFAPSAGYGFRGSFFQSSGKWYFEAVITAGSYQPSYTIIGIQRNSGSLGSYGGTTQIPDGYGFFGSGYKYNGTTYASFGSSFAFNDVFGVAYDLDAGNVYFYKNGSLLGGGAAFSSITAGKYAPYVSNQTTSDSDQTGFVNFGQRPFSTSNGEPPSGYKALNLANLPITTPSIVRPQKHFDTVLYTGNASDQKITGLEFKPDMIWFKSRTSTSTHGMADSVRGRSKLFYPDTDQAEETSDSTRDLVSFDDGGFTVGNPQRLNSTNGSGLSIVAWCWKAGGTAVSNSDGSITSSVSANTEAGFSIVTWTGTGSDGTIGHGLGAVPSIYFVKRRNSAKDWYVQIGNLSGIDLGRFLKLNELNALSFASDVFAATADTSTVLNTKSDSATNASGDTYVAYCWTEIPGYSKFGSYEGNQDADGTYVHLGFKPAWIIVKNADNSSNRHWCIVDTTRSTVNKSASAEVLFADDSQVESYANNNYGQFGSKPAIDILSNGFKVREGETSAYTQFNRSNTHIYMAFAEQPGTTPFDTFPNAR